jgi:pimeloyl-ACP methyl ester carboxylesterase
MQRFVTGLLAVTAVLGSAQAASGAAPPKLRETCLTAKERAGAVSFRASDGTQLAGVVLGSGPRAVVLSHEYGADLCSWLPYGRTLVARGFRVLAIDLRGAGSSGQPPGEAASRFDRDVVAAAKLVRSAGAKRVVLAGGSIGGAAVLIGAASIPPSVDGVISVSSPASAFGLDALAAVRHLRAPVLIVNGRDDPITPVSDARRLYGAAASRSKRLVILPGSLHGSALLSGTGGAHARSILTAFISARLGG